MPVSPAALSRLEKPPILERHWQACAMLNALIEPNKDCRVFSFVRKWKTDCNIGIINDQQGDSACAMFHRYGTIIQGLNKCSPLAKRNSLILARLRSEASELPAELRSMMGGVPIVFRGLVFCVWWTRSADRWEGNSELFEDDNAVGYPLEPLDLVASGWERFDSWIADNYSFNLDTGPIVRDLFSHKPLDAATVKRSGELISWDAASKEAARIGFPVNHQ